MGHFRSYLLLQEEFESKTLFLYTTQLVKKLLTFVIEIWGLTPPQLFLNVLMNNFIRKGKNCCRDIERARHLSDRSVFCLYGVNYSTYTCVAKYTSASCSYMSGNPLLKCTKCLVLKMEEDACSNTKCCVSKIGNRFCGPFKFHPRYTPQLC